MSILARMAAVPFALALCPTPVHASEPSIIVSDFPEILSRPPLKYPEPARKKGLEGTVVVQVFVDTEGRVTQWKVVKSSPDFDDAAVKHVRKFRFRPSLSNGRAVSRWLAVPIRYRLTEDPILLERVPCPWPDVERRVDASVVLSVLVDSTGRMTEWNILESNPAFDKAAIDCARRYRYQAARNDGRSVAAWLTVLVRFATE